MIENFRILVFRRTFRLLLLCPNRVPHRLANHPAMHAQLPPYPDHRPNPKLILPARICSYNATLDL